jgi:6-phosphogluconolactonase
MALCLGLAALSAHAQDAASSLVYIGTRGVPATDQGQVKTSLQGIYAARLDTRTGKLAPLGIQSDVVRATWLVTHPTLPVLYSVAWGAGGEQADANIHGFKVDKASGKLQQINQVSSGAIGTTYLALDGKSNTLFGAGFESGVVTALPIQADGSVGKVVSSQKQYGTGPHARQKAPHPHAVVIDPSGRYLLSPDLGADRLFVYRFDAATRALTPAETPFEQLPPGSAPRHLAFHPNGKFLYMNTELTAEVRIYRWDAQQGRLQLVETVSAYPAGYTGNNKSFSEIAFSSDGRFLYAALRGDQDSLVVYDVNKDTGSINEIQRISSQGKRPWSFGIDPTGQWMLVLNEATHSVNVFSVDQKTGKLNPTSESLSIPNPATVVFYPN